MASFDWALQAGTFPWNYMVITSQPLLPLKQQNFTSLLRNGALALTGCTGQEGPPPLQSSTIIYPRGDLRVVNGSGECGGKSIF
jgi:hypothetical protein